MNFIDKHFRVLLLSGLLSAALPLPAHDSGPEYIQSFDTTLQIRESGVLAVSHVVDVHPHGEEIRRGLFFELPDNVGPLGAFEVTLDGEPIEPDFDDGAIIVAAQQPLAVHRMHRFAVRYRAGSPWWLEDAATARLRWDPIIQQFELPWRGARLRIRWPDSLATPELPAAGERAGDSWTRVLHGPLHDAGRGAAAGRIEVRADATALPAGAVRRHAADWAWRTLLGFGMLALLGYLHGAWRAVGRDPELGNIVPSKSAPDGLSPAATRFVDRMGFDQTAFVAALVSLRVKGALELEVDDEGDSLQLSRRRETSAMLSPGERAVMDSLLKDNDEIELGPGDERAARAAEALKKKLGQEHRGRHFVTNARQRTLGIVLGLVVAGLALAALVAQAQDDFTPDPWGAGLGIAALLVGVFAPLIYFELFKAPTRAGLPAKRQIAGLKRYLEQTSEPVRDPRHFVELLPYAIALDCEAPWRQRFTGADDVELDHDVAEILDWYRTLQQQTDSAAAIVPIIAGAAGASAATGAAGAGGASAGGV